MKTVGEILKKTRLEKKVSLDEAEKATRIRKKFLSSFEENDFSLLPAFTFSRGFLKNYSEFLGLNSEEVIAVFRRQVKTEEKTELLPSGVNNPQENPWLKINPKTAVILVSALIFGFFLFYIFSQLLSFAGRPYLKIYSPKENLTVKNETIEIKGKTDPDGKLLINNQEVQILVNGNFFEKIDLNKGENKIVVSVKNKTGKENKKEIRVTYK